MADTVRDLVPLVALLALLAVAVVHPPEWLEALVGVGAAAVVLAFGQLDSGDLSTERDHLLPVVGFLMAILVVAECCRAAGLFGAIGARLARDTEPHRLFRLTFLVATVVTVALSLDATVVLLTPVVLAAGAGAALDRPLQLVCVRLANSASLLLPVSNLTNLLAMPYLGIGFGRFALLMAPTWLLTLALEYAGHRWFFRHAFAADPPATPVTDEPLPPLPRTPLLVVAAMLVAFAVGSPFGIDPVWFAGIAAVVLVGHGLARGELTVGRAVRSTHASFAVFVLGLGLVVEALGHGPVGDLVARLVPDDDGLSALLALAVLGAVLANLLNNLPATLLLVPLVGPLGTVPVLATLVGINLGSSLTWPGSLANLLWRRTVRRSGGTVRSRDFHLVALLVTPVAIGAGVVVLHLWAGLV
ncbi:SLC13 family permease [Marmoricola sp. RAF53]|uniref:SLC13 family permease n=1 Tax=Marmoricola sp. RAF53 TaxID=3233059 RepID=UPI003F95346C